ncbi:MAG TPA: 2-C-methyl-D-erythritol 4-phosphate cytidylyltransferase [Gemmatimonadales bacterium]|nr:2-C-methyl-D-erythritol 4-phosphate cytidylyltransferase [Gemmatimonadales bacterium]
MPRDVGVVLVAAGQGTRLGDGTPKQYRLLGGVPLVLRALRHFTGHPDVREVALVLPPSDVASPPGFLAQLTGGSLRLVAGGAERRDSVAAGLAALGPECAVVLVHDAARPFVAREVIDAVIAHARRGEGAIAALPVSDTVKEAAADDAPRVARPIPRDRLWRAQTPQGFPRALLTRAHAAARESALRATDDAMLVEACGGTVRLVPDTARNLKITTAEDLALAELLCRERP